MALAAMPAQATTFMDEWEPDFFTGAGQYQTADAVDPFSIQIGDANADGQINIADVTALIGYILTGAWSDE